MNEILDENKWHGECGLFTDKNTTHNYIDGFYESAFSEYRNRPIKILEIGVASGHSLLLWDKYFVNNKGVYGIDLSGLEITKEVIDNQNINLLFYNAYDTSLSKSLTDFDIIIDDGPHSLESMVACLILYLPRLNYGGTLVIEDVQSMDWIPVLEKVFQQYARPGDSFVCVDLRSTKGRYDDVMFVVKRQ